MTIKTEKRKDWHDLYQKGHTTKEIALSDGVTDLVVVKTLRHPRPKIKGACYTHLKIPIPQEEVVSAYYSNTFKEVATKYGVSVGTIRSRLPIEMRGTKPYTRKLDKLTTEDETKAINAFYLSGRKFNATDLSAVVLKQLLESKEIVKESYPLNPRHQLALIDSILTYLDGKDYEVWWFSPLQATRKTYELKGDNPLAWKGQVLDWFLTESINEPMMRVLHKAIEDVSKYMGSED
jgi:hypothetical protein